MKFPFALLVLSLAVSAAFAASKERTLASNGKMDFSRKSPSVQRIDDADALPFLASLQALEEMANEEDPNLAEYRRLGKYLEGRGFKMREERGSRGFIVPSRYVTFRRKKDEVVPASGAEPGYTSLGFDFNYSQSYRKPEEGDKAAYPSLEFRGTVFFRCYGKEECRFATASFQESAIVWRVPAQSRGAQSSAGGVKPKE
jgi:hypothetical protein